MNEKEISEVRRTLKTDRHAISTVCGCYVNAAGEVIAKFSKTPGLMTEEETENYLAIFRKTLSGMPGKNLLDISFSNEQVLGGEEYKLLDTLKRSELKDTEALDRFYAAVTGAVAMEENFLILLAYNKYDVPYRAGDGSHVEADSTAVYSYLICGICPVKSTRSALTYQAAEKSFGFSNGSLAVGMPELGFLFPAFDGRQTNIYNSLLYTRNASDAHESFTEAVFRQSIQMTATTQNETFRTVLAEALEAGCSFQVAKAMHREISAKIEEHKSSHDPEQPAVSKYEVKEMLEGCGVSPERVDAFSKGYTESFGAGTDLNPKILVDPKKFELRTPNVVIKVAPGMGDLVETRVIDGCRYILIRADDGVELNGLNVMIDE